MKIERQERLIERAVLVQESRESSERGACSPDPEGLKPFQHPTLR